MCCYSFATAVYAGPCWVLSAGLFLDPLWEVLACSWSAFGAGFNIAGFDLWPSGLFNVVKDFVSLRLEAMLLVHKLGALPA